MCWEYGGSGHERSGGDVHGRALDCGHHLALEAPDETYAELYNFFKEESR